MSKEYKQTIKYYHILLLSIILSPLLIINSNFAVEKRNKEKLNIEADRKFKKILFGRHLETFEEGMKKICNKGTEELKEYYNSGALSKLDIELPKNEEEEENPEYINALLDIVKGYVGEESEHDIMENAKTYGMHILGIGVFLVITILCIPGWIVCCFCCCCNCCCCCCCKKVSCKVPFFIVTTVLYVLVAAVCIFGLIKSNYIFKGVADTECSILKFFNEIIEGETKTEKPKWIGITGIKNLLSQIQVNIDSFGDDIDDELETNEHEIETLKNGFKGLLKSKSETLTTTGSGNTQSIPDETNSNSDYRLDITTEFMYGKYDESLDPPEPPTNSFMYYWYNEFEIIAENAETNVDQASTQFLNIIRDSSISSSLDSAKDSVEDIGKSIDEIKNGISNGIIEYSDYIDDYGKLGFKIYFTVLIVIDASIALLMFLLCFFSGKLCNKCCCCRCIFKLFIHLFWNILALLMIITFLMGFLFSFIGTIGKDMISVLNYFISAENLDKPEPTLFGEAGTKLNKCFNGDGDITQEIGFDTSQIGFFDQLNDAKNEIITRESEFTALEERGTYFVMMDELKKRVEYSTIDFTIHKNGNEASSYKLSDIINTINSQTSPQWRFSCNSGENCYNPKNIDDDKCTGYTDDDLKNNCKRVQGFVKLVEIANGEVTGSSDNFKAITDELKREYDTFLSNEKGVLTFFEEKIDELIGMLNEYIGDNGNVFGFINCKFIGNNILVILNNIKECLGTDFYTVGICLLMAGCSMAISICFTILLIIIINISVDQNKKEDNVKTIPYA